MKRFILLAVITLMTTASCTVFKDQCAYFNESIKNNSCYNDSCDLVMALELIKLTKPKWSEIEFEQSGIKFLQDFLRMEFPNLVKEYGQKKDQGTANHNKTENEIFEILIKTLFKNVGKNKDVLNKESAKESTTSWTNWLLGWN